MIYLDNAATTIRKPDCVIEAVAEAMRTFGNASRGTNEGAMAGAMCIFRARRELAAFFNSGDPNKVIFTSNATEALNVAINGILGAGDHVVTTVLEHNSVLRPLYKMEKERGVSLNFAGADAYGRIRYEEFEELVRPNTRAAVVTHASNLTGNRTDLKRIADILRRKSPEAVLIADVSQTAGATPVDMEAFGIDILCFTGHKSMMGPQGTGGLVIRGDVDICPLKCGGTGVQSYLATQPKEYPTRLEAGTLNGHGIAGLSAAVRFLNETGVKRIEERETALMRRFYEGIRETPGVTVYGDIAAAEYGADSICSRSPIVTLNIHDYDSGLVADELSLRYGIATRPGAHCAPLAHRALGTEAQGAVRFSFNWFNTEEEIDTAIKAVREIAER